MRFVLTGGFGCGKTTALELLAERGHVIVPEFARIILAEQRANDGGGVPDRDPQRFVDLMLDRALDDHSRIEGRAFFDRALPDLIAYAEIFGLDPSRARTLAEERRYDDPVFFLPSWPEIYTTDDERKATFEQSKSFGDRVRAIYGELRYRIVDVPIAPPMERVAFIEANVC